MNDKNPKLYTFFSISGNLKKVNKWGSVPVKCLKNLVHDAIKYILSSL